MPPAEHSPSLREALSASFDAATAAPAGGAQTAAPEPVAATSGETPARESSTPTARSGARDEHGRFTTGAADQAGTTAPAEGGGQTQAAAAPAEPEMPAGYDPAVWQLLPPEARAKTAAYAGTLNETVKERDKRLERYSPLEKVLEPRRQQLAATYGGDAQALERLFALSDWAVSDPRGFLSNFARERGINLADLAQNAAQGQQQGPAQPQGAMDIRQMIAEATAQARQAEKVEESYAAFVNDATKEHRTNPRVLAVMSALLTAGQANDYAQAYDMATRADPEIGPKMLQAPAAAPSAPDPARRMQEASRKAAAASSTVGAPGTARPAPPDASSSVRSAALAAWDMHAGGRV